MAAQNMSPQELVVAIKAKYEMSWDELGAAMGRSPRMMRKVARGETSGAAYTQALNELYERGQVNHPAPRRRNAAGNVVAVRAKRGAANKLVVPKDETGRFKPAPKRGRFAVSDEQVEQGQEEFADPDKGEIYFPEGGRLSTVEMPKSRGAKGRKAGLEALMKKIRGAAQGQRNRDKRVRITAEFDTGDGKRRIVEVGHKSGYAASDIVADVRKLHGGNVADWINHQTYSRYDDFTPGPNGPTLVKATVTVFNATRPKEERKHLDNVAQAAAPGVGQQRHPRRWNRDLQGQRINDIPRGDRRNRGRKSNG